MDSRLLNVVYDDPFDGNYAKYDDNDAEFWSSGSETMGMQLTETLNGILPIAPTEDFHKDEHTNAINIQTNKNAFNYEDFAGQHLASGGAIEIVTVDPNDGYDTDSEDEEDSDDDDDDDDDDEDNNALLNFDRQSQCSNGTFRTRTDSSSIGDYESHTSDYDDDSDDDDKDDDDNNLINNTALLQNALANMANMSNNANNSIIDLHSNLVAPDDLLLDNSFHKSRTLSTNTLNSDVDGLGLQIDANNFDLAEFITKDDFQLQNTSIVSNQTHTAVTAAATAKSNILPKNDFATNIAQTPSVVQVISSKLDDSDSDSDVIVDVETVEMDEDDASSLRKASEILKPTAAPVPLQTEEETPFVDNVKSDPSWSPTQTVKKVETHKVEEKPATQKPNFTRNFPLVPNKKQCDLLKGKFAKVKGKATQKPKTLASKNIKIELSPVKETPAITKNSTNTTTTIVKPENNLRKIGIGMGGKNLALLKHERVSISEQSSEDNNTPIKREVVQISSSPQQQQQKPLIVKREVQETPAQKAQAVKRKLNLEEYKKRRGVEPVVAGVTAPANAKFISYKIPKLENKTNSSKTAVASDKKPTVNTTPTKHSEAVTSIVKTLKDQQNVAPKTDPITEAKNKVLRMQELKKAQQMRIIDSTISAKVPRVTKLLPLREIVKDTPYLNEEEKKSLSTQAFKSDYEEIIIVSASCNTDISIPPLPNQSIQPVNNATRSLLKSSALLSTITNSFEKVKANDNVKISTSSLIASIQDVVVNKTLPLEDTTPTSGDVKDTKKPEHHGEDKIIMHLRKDRIRKRMCTIAIQTDLQPEFPPLPLPKSCLQHKSRERTRRHHKRQYRKHTNEQSSSSSSEYSSDDQSDHSNSSTISRSRDNSCSSSVERMRTYDSAIGTGGYSSRSSRKHRSSLSSSYSESADRIARGRRQRRTSYTKRSAARKRSRSPYSSSSFSSDSDRSRSPHYRRSRSRSNSRTRSRSRRSSYRQGQNNNNSFVDRNVSQPAVEERRIVYVGRIEQETTKDMLRRKFLQYGTIKQISIHYKDTGMKYGFVTFERSQDAFSAIDNSTRDPQINMYDVSFGGRRAFCRASYADLDNAGINTYHSYVFPQPAPQPKEDDSFEALLMKMKAKLNANKTSAPTATAGAAAASTETTTATNGQNVANNKI
ncbi:myb-like protein O [Lucilia sericata]|uniref:myb-like protein O n=1 Tax=Lucilia sericata TaxID=13632 RepID=UPI0018A8821F|nr:myb-like protein O [Lucilia sericata]XP_037814736.1 myb-like protein O [Lucilia sericata]